MRNLVTEADCPGRDGLLARRLAALCWKEITMSRIGKKPVSVPAGVNVAVHDHVVTVEGPKGKLEYAYRPEVQVDLRWRDPTGHRDRRQRSRFECLSRADPLARCRTWSWGC